MAAEDHDGSSDKAVNESTPLALVKGADLDRLSTEGSATSDMKIGDLSENRTETMPLPSPTDGTNLDRKKNPFDF